MGARSRRHATEAMKLAGLQQAQAPRRAPRFEPFIGLFLLLCRHDRLTCVAPLTNPGPRNEFSAASPALLGHRFFQRKNSRFLREQMRIVKITVIHVRHLVFVGNRYNWEYKHPGSVKPQADWV